MSISNFSTERLQVNHWRDTLRHAATRQDLEVELADLLSKPVLEHLPPRLQLDDSSSEISTWIDARAAESDVLLVSENTTHGLVGLLIVAADPDSSDIHFGYLFGQNFWGKGYATELIKGLVSGLKTSNAFRLIGGVGVTNPASARVLEKSGFQKNNELSTPDTDIFVYGNR